MHIGSYLALGSAGAAFPEKFLHTDGGVYRCTVLQSAGLLLSYCRSAEGDMHLSTIVAHQAIVVSAMLPCLFTKG